MRSIETADFQNARVLIRVDFNIERTNITETEEHFRIKIAKQTIDRALSFPGAKVALLTHFGRPNGAPNEADSTRHLVQAAEHGIGRKVRFVPALHGPAVEEALQGLPEGEVLLLENVRFDPGEEAADPEFAKLLAAPFTHYVNEAFSVCHRKHASMVGVPAILPSFAGYRLLEEIDELGRLLSDPARPAIALLGGAKIETKLPLIRAFEKEYDCVLVGGMIANEALDQKIAFKENVLLPIDFNGSERFDIGPNTIAYYSQMLKTAKTILWNGPMGKFEEKPYDMGTNMILAAILETDAYFVIGGGESIAVLERADALGKVSFVSSGGGAMLAFLGGEELPGLVALG